MNVIKRQIVKEINSGINQYFWLSWNSKVGVVMVYEFIRNEVSSQWLRNSIYRWPRLPPMRWFIDALPNIYVPANVPATAITYAQTIVYTTIISCSHCSWSNLQRAEKACRSVLLWTNVRLFKQAPSYSSTPSVGEGGEYAEFPSGEQVKRLEIRKPVCCVNISNFSVNRSLTSRFKWAYPVMGHIRSGKFVQNVVTWGIHVIVLMTTLDKEIGPNFVDFSNPPNQKYWAVILSYDIHQ